VKTPEISVSSVQRIWRAHGLQPHRHRVRQFNLSNDPKFAAKLHEIVGHRALDRLNPLTSLW
jgi:hypothetical protein